jgi:DNA recombination protein RmuC
MDVGLFVLAGAIVVSAIILFFRKVDRTPSSETSVATIGQIAGKLGEAIEGQNRLSKDMTERLEAVERRVNTALSATAEKTAETLGNLQTRLGVIDAAQANLIALSGQVVSLQEILSDKQTRGAFGQAQMESIVSDQIPKGHFEFQARLSNNTRPDCIIKISKSTPAIVIDSKFPFESFETLRTAAPESDKTRTVAKLRSDMLKHIKDIASKYLIPGETQSPALLFVPAESIYSTLHNDFPDVIQTARREQVVIVSPHILMLAVNTIRALMRDVQMREEASVIQKQVSFLLQDVRRLEERTGRLRQHFDLANRDISEIETSAAQITGRAQKIDEVDLGDEPKLIGGPDSTPSI